MRRFAAILTIALLAAPIGAGAMGRDADGSRMQARQIKLDATEKDRLAPPGDAVDWRYFRLRDGAKVTLEVRTNPKSKKASISLTSAVGKTIASGSTSDGSYSVTKQLDPGLYYFAVSSDESLSYSVNVSK